jgi:hypothetical protein
LSIGFLLSMHVNTIPFLFYDKAQKVLVVLSILKERVVNEVDSAGITHLYSCMKRMGLKEEDGGSIYRIGDRDVMSLIDEDV